MQNISKSVSRKFIDRIDLNDWLIEADTGWEDVSAIHKTIEYNVWNLKTSLGKTLSCADNHIVFDENYQEIFVKDLKVGHKIQTVDGLEIIFDIKCTSEKQHMFDLTVETNNHRYYTNGILSHNTEAMRCFALHYIIFNEQKTVALLANKGSTAMEILGKIQTAYRSLPTWLQMGVVEWNKGSFVLENGSRILASATSSDAIRGFTVQCVSGESKVCVEIGEDYFYCSINSLLNKYPELEIQKESLVFDRAIYCI